MEFENNVTKMVKNGNNVTHFCKTSCYDITSHSFLSYVSTERAKKENAKTFDLINSHTLNKTE